MGKIDDVTTRKVKLVMNWNEFRSLILEHTQGLFPIESRDLKIKIEQIEEGSPPYRVDRWRLVVTAEHVVHDGSRELA